MRPKQPLLARLSKAMPDAVAMPAEQLAVNLKSWPDFLQNSDCWFMPRLIRGNDSKMVTTVRAFIETALDRPLHPSWRVRRTCRFEDCRNPHHHELYAAMSYTHAHEPLPLSLVTPKDLANLEIDETEEVIDAILSWDDGRSMSPEAINAELDGNYDLDTIKRALARIQEEGL